MPPVELVELAAELGVGAIGMALAPFTANPHGYPGLVIARRSGAAPRAVRAALAANGVALRLGEGFLVRPGSDIGAARATTSI